MSLMLVSETFHPWSSEVAAPFIPFMHQQDMRSPRDIRMHGNREDTYLVRIVSHRPVEIVEMVSPEILDIARIHPTVAIWGALNKEHWR